MTLVEYHGLKFRYKALKNELQRMQIISRKFLSAECAGVFEQCVQDLENIQNSISGKPQYWSISDSRPIKTVMSEGRYRNSVKESGRKVYGTVSFRWGITNPRISNNRGSDNFHLVSEATTSIKIYESKVDDPDVLVAQWQLEAGDAQSPGCHFHAAMNQYGDNGLFPEWLKVPRLPSLLLTPMDGLEFLLGEIFQNGWKEKLSEGGEAINSWSKHQKDRLERLLNWKLECIKKSELTPWMDLKLSKPALELFN